MLQPELKLRRDKIRVLMAQQEIDAALITCNVNLIYTYGRVVSGYLYLPLNAPARLFIKRPNNIEGEHIHSIRKPEQLPDLLKECGLPLPAKLMLEGDELSYTEYTRLAACFPETTVVNGTPLIRKARSVKTNIEIEMFRRSGIAHTKAYEQIPSVYRPGMTDRQLSIEIERLMRLEGCLGIFRTFGQSMEIFMGSLLAGDNAIFIYFYSLFPLAHTHMHNNTNAACRQQSYDNFRKQCIHSEIIIVNYARSKNTCLFVLYSFERSCL